MSNLYAFKAQERGATWTLDLKLYRKWWWKPSEKASQLKQQLKKMSMELKYLRARKIIGTISITPVAPHSSMQLNGTMHLRKKMIHFYYLRLICGMTERKHYKPGLHNYCRHKQSVSYWYSYWHSFRSYEPEWRSNRYWI